VYQGPNLADLWVSTARALQVGLHVVGLGFRDEDVGFRV
jgi:hypothetical protein